MELFFGHDINLEQSQKLTLTPELIQSLNILQFNRGELLDYVYDAMMENPVIEVEMPDQFSQQVVEASDTTSYEVDDDFGEEPYHDPMPEDYGSQWDAEDWYNYSERMSYDDVEYYGRNTYDSSDSDRLEYSQHSELTLEDALLSQLELVEADYMDKAMAAYIIQTLDDNGYMTLAIEEIAEELGVDYDLAQRGLEIVWTLDPAGVGAADLAQCLALQLMSIGRLDDNIRTILEKHMEDIALNRLTTIARALGISVLEVQDYADLLRSLEPKPGRMYAATESTKYVVPDVTVENINGQYNVRLNNAATPKVVIRSEYRSMLKDADKNSSVASFLSGRFNTAQWLIRSIEQRNDTIKKVSEAIVSHQTDFFNLGREALKPLTMKEIAEEVGVHESTVSRAVNGKYMQSSQGVFEMRFFFSGTGRYVSMSGESTSSESLKVMIRRLVDSEDTTKPMSDRSIAEAIMVTGVEISRRTVAKYREELGIPSSSLRRRVGKM